jgi:hypothetical protein
METGQGHYLSPGQGILSGDKYPCSYHDRGLAKPYHGRGARKGRPMVSTYRKAQHRP